MSVLNLPNLRYQKKSNYTKKPRVYDIFLFFNELELLEIRLSILDKYVDHFVIVESTQTFSGLPKELYYENNKHLFKKFNRKIIHHIVSDTPNNREDLKIRLENKKITALNQEIINHTLTSDSIPDGANHWLREFYQKESIKKALVHLNDDDICYVSDLDEIWNPKIKIGCLKDTIYRLRQLSYAYFLNNRSSETWEGTLVTRYENIRNNCLNDIKTRRGPTHKFINNAGWHFTNQGGADNIRKKIEAYGHQEFNNNLIKSNLEYRIAKNIDYIGRNYKFWKEEKNLPEYILNNKKKYLPWFK